MERKGFSVGEVLKFGWEEWKKSWLLWFGITLFAVLIPMIPQAMLLNISEDAVIPQVILRLIHLVLTILVNMGILTIALKAAKFETFTFSDFFSKFHLFPSYLWGKILFIMGLVIGLILLVIPGVIFALKFNLWPFFVLDKTSQGLQSLKESNQAVNGAKWDIFMFWIAAIFLNILGLLFLGIGILITWPLTLIAWAKVYLKLVPATEIVKHETGEIV